jgi:hypothetical protein
MPELEQQEVAYNAFAALRTRIDDIRDCKQVFKDEEKLDFSEIKRQTSMLVPSIMWPILNNFIEEIDRIPDLLDLIKSEIQKNYVFSQELFGQTSVQDSHDANRIYIRIRDELKYYKECLLEYEAECERLSITTATDNILKLQWEISLELICDLFKTLDKFNKITNEKGHLVKFITAHFLAKDSREQLAKHNVANHISGDIKNERILIEFLNGLIKNIEQDQKNM